MSTASENFFIDNSIFSRNTGVFQYKIEAVFDEIFEAC